VKQKISSVVILTMNVYIKTLNSKSVPTVSEHQ
jgi:hypothetical protein